MIKIIKCKTINPNKCCLSEGWGLIVHTHSRSKRITLKKSDYLTPFYGETAVKKIVGTINPLPWFRIMKIPYKISIVVHKLLFILYGLTTLPQITRWPIYHKIKSFGTFPFCVTFERRKIIIWFNSKWSIKTRRFNNHPPPLKLIL